MATRTNDIYTLSLHDALPIWRSGLICLARSSRTGLDMSHILFMVEILLLTKCDSYLNQSLKIGRAVQQECRDRTRMPSYARKKKASAKSTSCTCRPAAT